MSSPTPLNIAVVSPVRNRQKTTLRFLKHLCDQTYVNFDPIIVDSSSTDGTDVAVSVSYPKVKLLKASAEDYWAGAVNIGVEFALKERYELILIMNDDSIFSSNFIESLLKIFQNHGILILGTRINYLNHPNLIWSMGIISNWGTTHFVKPQFHNIETSSLPSHFMEKEVFQVDAVPGNAVLIHRSVYEKIGLYNKFWTPHHLADAEFSLRAATRGITSWIAPNIVLLNDFSIEQKKVDVKTISGIYFTFFKKKSYLFLWGWLYIFIRYCPWRKKLATLWSIPKRLGSLNFDKAN